MSEAVWIMPLDIAGTFVFAMSGWLTAIQKQLDYFGGLVIAIVTAVGGGTLRDVMLGNTPVNWVQSQETVYAIVAGVLFAQLFYRWMSRIRRTLFLFDTLGIGVFTISGVQLALTFDIHPIPAILLGIASAVAGGVIRDTLCNEIPLVFRKELYATACLSGASLYWVLHILDVPAGLNTLLSFAVIVAFRSVAVWRNIQLPLLRPKSDEDTGKG